MPNITRTQLAQVASVPVTDGTLVTVPASGGVLITSAYRAVQVQVNLSAADKLAVGKTLTLNSFFSFDGGATWQFINGINWTSYGPNGYTSNNPDGTTTVNPDPIISVPLNGRTGQLARLQYQAQGIATAGVTIFGIS